VDEVILVTCGVLEQKRDGTVLNGMMNGADKIRVFRSTWDVWCAVEDLTDNTLIVTSNCKVTQGKALQLRKVIDGQK